ncbi:MAG: HU family DNA-binding protein [Sphingobacteriia bacterium]|nr:HU family DNA-binding protein [Sphingobacteriia bacterium]
MHKNTVTRAYLSTSLNKKVGFSESETSLIVNSIINLICRSLANNEKINITNFGSFQLKEKNARVGRNPKTLQEYPISARNVVKFKISKKLKQKIKDKFKDEN